MQCLLKRVPKRAVSCSVLQPWFATLEQGQPSFERRAAAWPEVPSDCKLRAVNAVRCLLLESMKRQTQDRSLNGTMRTACVGMNRPHHDGSGEGDKDVRNTAARILHCATVIFIHTAPNNKAVFDFVHEYNRRIERQGHMRVSTVLDSADLMGHGPRIMADSSAASCRSLRDGDDGPLFWYLA